MATCDGCGRRLTVVDPGQTRHPDPTCDPDPAPRLTPEVYAAWLAEQAQSETPIPGPVTAVDEFGERA